MSEPLLRWLSFFSLGYFDLGITSIFFFFSSFFGGGGWGWGGGAEGGGGNQAY